MFNSICNYFDKSDPICGGIVVLTMSGQSKPLQPSGYQGTRNAQNVNLDL